MLFRSLFSSGRRPRCPGQRLRNHALKLIQKRKTTKSGERNSVPERIFQALQDKHRINNVKFFGNPIFFINFAPAEGSGAGLLPVGTVGTRQRHVSAAIAQLVEHFIRNEKVVGSSPTRGSRRDPAENSAGSLLTYTALLSQHSYPGLPGMASSIQA